MLFAHYTKPCTITLCYLFSIYKQGVYILLKVMQKDCYKSAINADRSKTPCFKTHTHGRKGKQSAVIVVCICTLLTL